MQRARQAQRIAAQRERILVAGRLQARGETAGERVEAFGDREHLAQLRRRDRVAGEARHVGLVDRVRDLARLALAARVVAASDALQLRELADHARLQVGLRQFRGATRQRRIDADLRGDGFGQRGDARDLVGDGAELLPGRSRSPGPSLIDARPCFRSSSKKNFASAKRGRITRS